MEKIDGLLALHENVALDMFKTLGIDDNTKEHSFNVANLMSFIIKELCDLGLDINILLDADKSDVLLGALVHDIGKCFIPYEFLSKSSSLTFKEFEIIKCHSKVGYQVIDYINSKYKLKEQTVETVASMVALHHENFNGTGYPYGLRGCQIPTYVRILTVLDVYDALVSTRPYKKGMDKKEALDIIYKDIGRKYDPVIVSILSIYFNKELK